MRLESRLNKLNECRFLWNQLYCQMIEHCLTTPGSDSTFDKLFLARERQERLFSIIQAW